MDRKQWLEERRLGIGASEVAIILGVHSWGSKWSLWAEKYLGADTSQDSEQLYWGRALESAILERFCENRSIQLPGRDPFEIVRHERFDANHMFCTPDLFMDYDGFFCVDAKNVSEFSPHAKGISLGEIPLCYQAQLQAQMACLGVSVAYLACLIGGCRYVELELRRDEKAIAQIEKRCSEWWDRHVIHGEEPDIDGSVASETAVNCAFEVTEGAVVELDAYGQMATEEYDDIRSKMKDLDRRVMEMKNSIKAKMGDATIATIDGKVAWTWKNTKKWNRVLLRKEEI